MKKNHYFQTFLVGSLFMTGFSFSQKMNETQAAMDFKKYAKAAATGNMEDAKSALDRAKSAVDAAAEHPETKENSKTNYYKGEIYMGLHSFTRSKNDFKTAIDAYKKSLNSDKKFQGDIQESIFTYKRNFDNASFKMYNDSLYAEASDNYYNSVELLSVVGQIDTAALYFSGVAANQGNLSIIAADRFKKCADLGYKAPTTHLLASQALRKEKKFNEAKELIISGRKSFPSDRGLLLELVNTSIESGDTKGAESSLVEALAADPTNKQLYYVIGTIYMDLKQNEKAEEALYKAIQLDPDYADAQYQLGAHLLGVASGIREEASRLKFGDPTYDKLLAKSDEVYKKALVPLEAYISKIPNDKTVLTILFQIHKSLKNTEKALEFKKRADAAQ
jgi:tetratricopeptide (TPR) repeat protein